MKPLTVCIIAIALFLRAAPICAAPIQAEAVAMMPDCEQAPTHHDEKPGQKGSDASRACHACVYPPVADAALKQPAMVFAAPTLTAVKQLAGGALKPPTPPPRIAASVKFQQFNGV